MVANSASGGSCGGLGEGGMPGDRRGIQNSTGICQILQAFLEASYHLVSHRLATSLLFSRHFILFICALTEREKYEALWYLSTSVRYICHEISQGAG